jgi:hypothetical protein
MENCEYFNESFLFSCLSVWPWEVVWWFTELELKEINKYKIKYKYYHLSFLFFLRKWVVHWNSICTTTLLPSLLWNEIQSSPLIGPGAGSRARVVRSQQNAFLHMASLLFLPSLVWFLLSWVHSVNRLQEDSISEEHAVGFWISPFTIYQKLLPLNLFKFLFRLLLWRGAAVGIRGTRLHLQKERLRHHSKADPFHEVPKALKGYFYTFYCLELRARGDNRFFGVSDPLCLSSSCALHFFQLFFLGPPPC